MYGRMSDPEMTSYPPRVVVALRTPGWASSSQWCWGFYTVRSGIDSGDHHFRRRVVGRVHAAGKGPYLPRATLALQTPG